MLEAGFSQGDLDMELLLDLPVASLPGPARVPLLGSAPNVLRFFRDPVGRLVDLHSRHGDVVALNRGDATWIAVRGPERLRQVLSSAGAFHNLADSPIAVPKGSAPDILFGQALTAINGDAHRRARRLMQPVFAKGAVAGYQAEMAATVERVLATWKLGEADVAQQTLELALHVAMKSLFGVDPGSEAAEIGRLSQAFLEGVLSMGVMMFPFAVPGSPYSRWLSECSKYEQLLRKLIAARRARPDGRRDVLSTLIEARDADGTQMEETELVAHAAVLLTASHETTANTLAWTLFLLATRPQLYRDVVDELAATLHGAAPTVDQLAQLPLLDRVVKESQRLLPASCILFFRAAQEAFELGDHRIPAGARLLTSPFIAHRDPDIYPEPQAFKPERWENLDPSTYAYLPFGAGPRLCIGAQFAAQAIRTALAIALQRFRFELPPGTRIDKQVRGITLGPKHGLRMRLSAVGGAMAEPAPVAGDIHELVAGLPRV
jgi:cytochrome P450